MVQTHERRKKVSSDLTPFVRGIFLPWVAARLYPTTGSCKTVIALFLSKMHDCPWNR